MTDPTASCAPPAGTPAGSWHRLVRRNNTAYRCWYNGWWSTTNGFFADDKSEEMALEGWRYHSPVPTPEEVEELRAERDQLKRDGEAFAIHIANEHLRALTELRAERDALRAAVRDIVSPRHDEYWPFHAAVLARARDATP